MSVQASERTPVGCDKIVRYKWKMKDSPGELMMIHKDDLYVDPEYQRTANQIKFRKIAANWSWIAFGVITVGERDGRYWVVDGQHRHLAALSRSDIQELPCVVFQTSDIKTEAQGFLDCNTLRKPMGSIERFNALLATDDAPAVFLQSLCDELKIDIYPSSKRPTQLSCVGTCYILAKENEQRFDRAFRLAFELCLKDGIPVHEILILGLYVLDQKCGDGITDPRLAKRIREKGASCLIRAAKSAAAFYARGGRTVWAKGMLTELNKGMRNTFMMDGSPE